MLIEDGEALKSWLIQTVKPFCEADPDALTKYIYALVKKDKPVDELEENCRSQLADFFQDNTNTFVDILFKALKEKTYIAKPSPPSPTQSHESTLVDSTTSSTNKSSIIRTSYRPKDQDVKPSSSNRGRRSPSPRNKVTNRGDRKRRDSRSRSPRRSSPPRNRKGDKRKSRSNSPEMNPSKKRCADYDKKGYCYRGDSCLYDHGSDPVILDAITGLLGIPNSIMPQNVPQVMSSVVSYEPTQEYDPTDPAIQPMRSVVSQGGPGLLMHPSHRGPPPPLPHPNNGVANNWNSGGYIPHRPNNNSNNNGNLLPRPSNVIPINTDNVIDGSRNQHHPNNNHHQQQISHQQHHLPPHFRLDNPNPHIPHHNNTHSPESHNFQPHQPPNPVHASSLDMMPSNGSSDMNTPSHLIQNNGFSNNNYSNNGLMNKPPPPISMGPSYQPSTRGGRGRGGFRGRGSDRGGRFGPKPRQTDQPERCTLEVRKLPPNLNTISTLNEYFSKFGAIMNLQVMYQGEPDAAVVQFASHVEAKAAHQCPEAVLGNRFIKLFWHNKDQDKVDPAPERVSPVSPPEGNENADSNEGELPGEGEKVVRIPVRDRLDKGPDGDLVPPPITAVTSQMEKSKPFGPKSFKYEGPGVVKPEPKIIPTKEEAKKEKLMKGIEKKKLLIKLLEDVKAQMTTVGAKLVSIKDPEKKLYLQLFDGLDKKRKSCEEQIKELNESLMKEMNPSRKGFPHPRKFQGHGHHSYQPKAAKVNHIKGDVVIKKEGDNKGEPVVVKEEATGDAAAGGLSPPPFIVEGGATADPIQTDC